MDTSVSDDLIRILADRDPDSMKTGLIIWRREDGTIGYMALGENQHSADTMGLLDFVKLSVENDVRKSWEPD